MNLENNGNYYSVNDVSKSFGHIKALNNISIGFKLGEINAIVGDNGAGKSTLIKILSGAIEPDSGEILINEKKYDFLTPNKAIGFGIATVYQDLALVNSRDVASNVFLGRELTSFGFFVNKRKMIHSTENLFKKLNISLPDIKVDVGVLSGGQRQSLAIARAVDQGGKLLILDEPTAALGVQESERILNLIVDLKMQGYGIIIVSHNLQHVFRIADKISVLRHGRLIDTVKRDGVSKDKIVKMITGGVE